MKILLKLKTTGELKLIENVTLEPDMNIYGSNFLTIFHSQGEVIVPINDVELLEVEY